MFRVKAVMLDLDGTLVDSAPEIASAINLMLADLNLPVLPEKQVESYIGEGAAVLIKRCLNSQLHITRLNDEPDTALFAQAESSFFSHYANNVSDSKPYDGVVEGLQALRNKGLKLACVTNKPEKFTLPLLHKSGLAEFFEIVVSGDSLPKKKPDPMQLQHICEKLDIHTFEAMLVGDSDTDITAAHAAGCFIVTVPYGYNQGRSIDESKVDAMIENLTELVSKNLITVLL
ncbi:MAG: phosphoglycolate phosphatase [Methylotenera sp.]|uniref:phosphoglycolate phosphatase n=1 Tax=Methylotenera sp. TaxID=2051956 RepID=UPI0024875EC8|nr:phosphoglycolate phosphatase [Methylotenera sp.]MDI1308730.1 phosphoglycolate phosphatase [Methylotenera sp.]